MVGRCLKSEASDENDPDGSPPPEARISGGIPEGFFSFCRHAWTATLEIGSDPVEDPVLRIRVRDDDDDEEGELLLFDIYQKAGGKREIPR